MSLTQEGGQNEEMLRYQGGILLALGNGDVLKKEHTHIHLIFHQSTTLMRVVRATCQAETYHM